MSFSPLDIVALVIILLIALRVTFKGFVTEFMSKAGILVGVVAALLFTTLLAPEIDQRFALGPWSNILAFIALFVVGFVITKLLSNMLTSVLEALHLNFLDNMLGFVLGAVEGAVIVSFIVFVLNLQTVIDLGPMFQESWVVELLAPIAPYSIDFVSGNL